MGFFIFLPWNNGEVLWSGCIINGFDLSFAIFGYMDVVILCFLSEAANSNLFLGWPFLLFYFYFYFIELGI